jgi:uncharacterized membrane protein YuzA (DUF378 family)
MTQDIIAYVLLGLAVVFLIIKFLKPKKKKNCDKNCG